MTFKINLKFSKNDVLSNLFNKNLVKEISFFRTNKNKDPKRK